VTPESEVQHFTTLEALRGARPAPQWSARRTLAFCLITCCGFWTGAALALAWWLS
jgi:hypothetical protein